MASQGPAPDDIYDVRRIKRLVELMNQHDLSEIDLRQADTRIRIRRGPETVAQVMPSSVAPTAPAPAATVHASVTPPAASSPAADDKAVFIRSPMVGTFYAAPEPGKPPFVKVGDRVGPDTTVCIVEAMKVFNAIPAEVLGVIAAVLVENGQPVEYNQPLFRVDPSK
jgi:acetyl-CoA carboxylase biotin carboxyl carrier protein